MMMADRSRGSVRKLTVWFWVGIASWVFVIGAGWALTAVVNYALGVIR